MRAYFFRVITLILASNPLIWTSLAVNLNHRVPHSQIVCFGSSVPNIHDQEFLFYGSPNALSLFGTYDRPVQLCAGYQQTGETINDQGLVSQTSQHVAELEWSIGLFCEGRQLRLEKDLKRLRLSELNALRFRNTVDFCLGHCMCVDEWLMIQKVLKKNPQTMGEWFKDVYSGGGLNQDLRNTIRCENDVAGSCDETLVRALGPGSAG
ncbi:MAG: hypothetical protein M1833_006199 [Piccolia ochrophora]|nr:MAG: hypothetical protein M1833_006199 [Piccolia ochrophora]